MGLSNGRVKACAIIDGICRHWKSQLYLPTNAFLGLASTHTRDAGTAQGDQGFYPFDSYPLFDSVPIAQFTSQETLVALT